MFVSLFCAGERHMLQCSLLRNILVTKASPQQKLCATTGVGSINVKSLQFFFDDSLDSINFFFKKKKKKKIKNWYYKIY